MHRLFPVLVLLFGTLPAISAGAQTAAAASGSAPDPTGAPTALTPRQATARLMQQPLHFEPAPKTPSGAGYIAQGPGYGVSLSPTHASIVLLGSANKKTGAATSANQPFQLDLTLVGASPTAQAQPLDPSAATSNYFIGSDPSQWRTGVAQFSRLRFAQVYPGVDVVYYGNGGQLEHDFVLQPGADLTRIRLHFSGQRPRIDTNGDLVLAPATTQGTGEVRLLKPTAYQQATTSATRQPVDSSYQVAANGDVSFTVGDFDRTRPLTIDPAIAFATYFGSFGTNVNGVALDAAGDIYLTGEAYSFDITTKNPLFPPGTGFMEVFVAELDPTAGAELFATFLGGNDSDNGNAIALDSKGNIYLTGMATSTNFPVLNAAQPSPGVQCQPFGNTCGNAFVTAIKAGGAGLIYSTYLGGSNYESGNSIAVDPNSNAYVTGTAASSNFPLKNALQSTFSGAFVAKYSPAGVVQYSTYLGGADNNDLADADGGNGIAVDTTGAAYVTGYTAATNFPVKNPIQVNGKPVATGAGVWVAKINPAGSALVYSDSLASAGGGKAIAVDSAGSAYVTGAGAQACCSGKQVPVTKGSFASNPGGAFVFKLTPAGTAFVYSARLGGNYEDYTNAIAVDAKGDAWVAGDTYSTNFPAINAFQTAGGGIMAVSEDAGATFAIRNTGLLPALATPVLIDPANAGSLLVGQYYDTGNIVCTASNPVCGGIFESLNGGFNWTRTTAAGLTDGRILSLVRSPVTATTLYALTPTGVFQSTDDANTWILTAGVATPPIFCAACQVFNLVADPFNAATLYLIVGPDRVYTSTNAGASWTSTSIGLPSASGHQVVGLIADPKNQGILYAATAYAPNYQKLNNVYKTVNHGASWAVSGAALPSTITSLSIDPENPATLYAGTIANGYYVSKKSGGSWTPGNTQYYFTGAQTAITVDPTNSKTLYAAVTCEGLGCGIYKSTDSGVTFSPTPYTNISPTAITVDPGNDANLYVASNIPTDTAFISELNPAGTALLFSSYDDGVGNSAIFGLAVSSTGSAVTAGFTNASNFPTTNNAVAPAVSIGRPAVAASLARGVAPRRGRSAIRPDGSNSTTNEGSGSGEITEWSNPLFPVTLALHVGLEPFEVNLCGSLDFYYTVLNESDSIAAKNVRLEWTKPDQMGPGVTAVSSGTSKFSCSGAVTFTCTLSSLPPGVTSSASVLFSGTMVEPGALINSATASASNSANVPSAYSSRVTVRKFIQPVVNVNEENPSPFYGDAVKLGMLLSTCFQNVPFPTGTVTVKDGATPLGSATLDSKGAATFTTSALPVGADSITVVYSGDKNYAPATSAPLVLTVKKAKPTITLKASGTSPPLGSTVTFTASVIGPATAPAQPAGAVSFADTSTTPPTTLGSGTLSASGVATFATSKLGVAKHTVTAVYTGDGNYLAVTSAPVTVTISAP